jgi:site-specific DNA-methyltransferase (adenine-specific)
MKQKNIELFYDYYDQIADRLYREYERPYLEGMNEAFNLLLDDTMSGTYEEADMNDFRTWKESVIQIDFEPEEIRKSVQLGMLKGYKHTYSSNALITPDTIGIFIAYLIQKLYDKTPETLLDPLIGSGNLAYTIVNQLKEPCTVLGVDNDYLKCQLSRNLGDLLDIENAMYYQDSLTYYAPPVDLIVTDMMIIPDGEPYLPYQIINHHLDSLQDNGYFIALIENDFFEQKDSEIFKQEIQKKAQVYGLIKLSESLFNQHPKSIFIIKKSTKQMQDTFLLVDLPPFTDQEGMTRTLQQIDQWIASRKDDAK